MARTIVYIDGFNLYYRALRDTPYRWLDPLALARALLPDDEVMSVKYFTARIKAVPYDPDAPNRQQVYLRALRTLKPTLRVEDDGYFDRRRRHSPLAIGALGRPLRRDERRVFRLLRMIFWRNDLYLTKQGHPFVSVWKTEEKGTDVNLGAQLLVDGFTDSYEKAAVITSDSDLAWPIRYVRRQLKKPVAVLNPAQNRNKRLSPPSLPKNSYARIEKQLLRDCQLPSPMKDAKGTFHRPEIWAAPKKR